jgi:LysM repeat protein
VNPTPNASKRGHAPTHDQPGQEQLLSRKLRHSRRKMFSYATLVKGGLVLFGTLFVGLVALELLQANRVQPQANVISKDSPPEKSPAAVQPLPEPASSTGGQVTIPAKPAANPGEQGKEPQPAALSATKEAAPPAQAGSTGGTAAGASKPKAVAGTKPKAIRYVVKQGDTLYKLSRQYYGNNKGAAAIARYNGLDGNAQLTAGTVIFIPLPTR